MTRERRAELRHDGDLRFVATTGTGRTIDFGDRADAGEHSPVELVTTALGACTAMDVVSILEKKRELVDDYVVRVRAIQRDGYPQVLTEIEVAHDVTGRVTEAGVRRAIELSALKYCPVNAMLSAGETEVRHRYRVRSSVDASFDAEGEVVVTGPYRRPDVVGDPAGSVRPSGRS